MRPAIFKPRKQRAISLRPHLTRFGTATARCYERCRIKVNAFAYANLAGIIVAPLMRESQPNGLWVIE